MRKEKVDVLVVGARCAGAATAMLTARRGLKVLAIDRGDYGADTLSTHALMRGAVLQLHRWGLLPRIVEAGTPEIRGTTFHYADEAVEVAIKASHGVEALVAPRRTVLDSVLVDAAEAAGADIRHGHSLAALLKRPDGRVAGAVVTDPRGRTMEVEADFVVGADGIGSSVARLAGAPVLREARHATAAIYGYWSGLDRTGYHWHYGEGASVAVIPTNAGLHCVCASMPPARFRTELRHDPENGFHRVAAEVAPALAAALAEAARSGHLRTFAGRKGFMRQATGPGWALVGDAGYFKDPLTAHGITDALRDAELLAEQVADGADGALDGYARTRDDLSLPLFDATDAIASFEWNLASVRNLHQALNQAMKREVEHLASLPAAPSAAPRRIVDRHDVRAGDPVEASA